MKREFSAIKSGLAKMIYRNMYKSNYVSAYKETVAISGRINEANKRAIEVAIQDKEKSEGLNAYCVVAVNAPVSKEDSRINKMALKLQD